MSLIERVRAVLPPQYREFAKFLVVGGTCWIVDTGLFTVLSHTILDSKVLTAKGISILVSTILSYVLNREWSFSARGGRPVRHEASLFFLFNALGMAINLIPLALSRYVIGINPGSGYAPLTVSIADFIAANVVGTALAMVFRYWSYRQYVFPQELAVEPAGLDSPSMTESAAEESAPAEPATAEPAEGTSPSPR